MNVFIKIIIRVLIAIAVMSAVPGSALSESTSTYMYVTATVGAKISASVSGSSLNFYTTTGSSTSSSGNLYVNGAVGVVHKITMNSGLYYDGVYRRVYDGYGNYSRYYITKQSGVEWGDSDFNNTYPYGSSLSYTGLGYLDSVSFNAYLLAPSIAGNYSDTVTVTVIW